MKIEDIIRLKQEGFEKEDILALAPFIDKDEQPVQKVEEVKSEKTEKEDKSDEIMDKLNSLTDLIHTSNIRQNSTADDPKSAEDVIAEIINPTFKRK